MNKEIIKYLLISIIVFSFFSQCGRKLTGWGDDAEIRVLADSTLWEATEPILREVFEKPIITPQDETVFTIIRGELNNFKRFKNLIFIATLEDEGKVAKLVTNNLTGEAKQKVKDGNYVFLKNDKWASSQIIMFLVSINTEILKQKIIENKDYLFNLFNNYWNETQKKQMFRFDEQIDVEKYLLAKYGWMIRIQHDYKIFIEDADSNFVLLRRHLPERWLFIHWIDSYDPSVITEEWCIKKRNKLGIKYSDGEIVEEKFVQPEFEDVDFSGRHALRTVGLWRNDKKQAGGPFRNYCFYDEHSKRIFMLDFAIFSPRLKKPKRHYLRQAEILLHTFKTDDEISVEDL